MVLKKTAVAMDWEKVHVEAKQSHLDLFLYCSLAIVRHYDAEAVPDDVLARVHPSRLTWAQRYFLHLQLEGKRIRGSSYLLYLSLNQGLCAKAAFLYRTFIPPSPIQRQRRREGRSSGTMRLYVLRVWEIVRYLAGVMPRMLSRR